ncbi:MAG: alpha-rhamnosidase [Clostridia bacterium]|nr:alpha-rhamnosidase [Clostridia bacterium]
MEKSKWIWYPGAFELYHSMLLHNRRTSSRRYNENNPSNRKGQARSVYYYPMWRIDGPKRNAILMKKATIDKEETVEFFANTPYATIVVDNVSYNPNTKITLAPGTHTVYLQGFKAESFPAFYCKGDTFKTDRSWKVAASDEKAGQSAGESELYTDINDIVEVFKFSYKRIFPVSKEEVNGGILYDFGKEVFGKVIIENAKKDADLTIYLGESREEALDTDYSEIILNAKTENGKYTSSSVALRYLFIKDEKDFDLSLNFEYLPLENRGAFKCDNELVNKLWETCAYTMLLNSREAFFDGIKRDRWVWSGDAYQTNIVNYYLYNDKDIVKRTIRMLRGTDPIKKHINTICDYTFLFIASILDYYQYTGDKDFIEDIYPEMLAIWEFVEGRLDDDGMYKRYPDDWVFIDWSTFDQNGPMCAENMLLCRAYEAMSKCAEIAGDKEMCARAKKQSEYIKEQVNLRYWSDEKGAFIDDYKSGRNNVTRHANIFAILFDYTSNERKESIIKNVIYNDEVTQITTPYFKFYELDAMCKIGDYEYMTKMLNSYWGAMLELGATTIWEEFDPTKKGIEHYEMYGGKYEKSLCHAWGASPIYLLGKYCLGVEPTGAGYSTYTVKPNLMCFNEIEGKVPLNNGEIYVKANKKEIEVLSPIDGGLLIIGENKYEIKKNEPLKISI